MMATQLKHDDELGDLIAAWRGCKEAEKQYNADRLVIEERILEMVGMQNTGSVRLDGLSISYGLDRKWDQAKLTDLKSGIKAEYWPFLIEWKEDKKASDIISDRFPELWDEIQQALTTKPKKPTFSIKE